MLSPSNLKLQGGWLHSFTRITYQSKLIGIHSLAAYLQHQFLWVYDVQSFMLKYIAKSMPTFQTPRLCHIIGVC
ncbi:hypothetical protein DVQ85_16150 [Yersinia enterocolitica]|nr:hypothetical protein [Yersinia enterocolitica]EKN5990280.1 hypothetical protein [Yersinia enterocolitica]